MARRFALIGCCAEKASSTKPLPARQLYRSQLFRKSLAWVESKGLEWFVISARFGLIPQDMVLMPYDHTMRQKTPTEREAWNQGIAMQLDAYMPEGERVELVLLAGEAYAGWIPKVQEFADVLQPMKGMQIGQRLQWLTDELREGQKELFA